MSQPALIPKLASVLEKYFTFDELGEFLSLFEVKLDADRNWLSVAKALGKHLAEGNTRTLVDEMIALAETRNIEGIANSSFERRDAHYRLSSIIDEVKGLIETSSAPREVSVPAGSVFSAKSKVRELLETANQALFVIDPYIGLGTLDCLRGITIPTRLLTADHQQAIEADFERHLKAFVAEGHELTVRRATGLHDRHIVFSDRCWLVGGSLKDAGRKAFNCIEITDKAVVVADLEAKWNGATPYP